MKRLMILPLFALAACGTPQERCINQVAGDLPTLDRLIAETEGNIARGFAWEEVTTTRTTFVDCTPHATKSDPTPATQHCVSDVEETTRKAVALDLNAEKAKLASMQERRAQLAANMAPAIEACRKTYPE